MTLRLLVTRRLVYPAWRPAPKPAAPCRRLPRLTTSPPLLSPPPRVRAGTLCTFFIPETRGFSLEELNDEPVPLHANAIEQGKPAA